MARAMWQTRARTVVGRFALGMHGGHVGSVAQMVHDGDTMNVRADGNFAIRFLGIDTPEVSYRLFGQGGFLSIANAQWQSFLDDPFAAQFPAMAPLSTALKENLETRLGNGAAQNHADQAEAAHRALEDEVEHDLAHLGWTEESARFFLAFAYEALDRYGRLLAFVHPEQPNTPAAQRFESYNQRMLALGLAAPYFIFPNVDPFHSQGSPIEAVAQAGSPGAILNAAPKLRTARQAVQQARQDGVGLYAASDPLRIEAFEVRMLADRRAPGRWLIDLSKPNDKTLLHPQAYHTVAKAEDRLWVPAEFVDLFVAAGWARGATPADIA